MRKNKYSWLMEATEGAAAEKKILDWGALGEAISGGAKKVWEWVQSLFNWVFSQGTEGDSTSSLLQGVKWLGDKIGFILGWIWDKIKLIWSGSDGQGGAKGLFTKAGAKAKELWSGADGNGGISNTLKGWGTSINSAMSSPHSAFGFNVSGWGLLAGTATVALVVYGFYRLYKWWKEKRNKTSRRALSEGSMSAPKALSMGEQAASMVSPSMIGQAFGPKAAKAYAFCCKVVANGAASAKVAEGTYRIMRNTGLKKSAARRIAQHTFCECITQ